MADFLTSPPIGPDATFEAELEQLGAWDDHRIRAEIRGPRPAGVFPTLGARRRWLGGGHLQINGYDLPTRDLSDARELPVPVHGNGSWVAWDLPERFAIVHPVTGALASVDRPAPTGLARLVGGNRARVLTLLDVPRSTTQLAALTGLPLGAVGNHLRVVLDAGAVLRRRSGREVLYCRTSLGDALVATGR